MPQGFKEEAPDGNFSWWQDSVSGSIFRVSPQSWQWDFGDGNTSNQRSPAHVFGDKGEFLVTLTVQTGPDCEASYQMFDHDYPDLPGDVSIKGGALRQPGRRIISLFPKPKGIAEMDLEIFSAWGVEFL